MSASGPGRVVGFMLPGRYRQGVPTMQDIAWAAGIYEGEGSFGKHCELSVQQNDPWLIERLRYLFGGSIVNGRTPAGTPAFAWRVSGARARGFVMTIYTFLSPRRQLRIREVLAVARERNVLRMTRSPATRAKIASALTGRVKSPEHLAHISAALRNSVALKARKRDARGRILPR